MGKVIKNNAFVLCFCFIISGCGLHGNVEMEKSIESLIKATNRRSYEAMSLGYECAKASITEEACLEALAKVIEPEKELVK